MRRAFHIAIAVVWVLFFSSALYDVWYRAHHPHEILPLPDEGIYSTHDRD